MSNYTVSKDVNAPKLGQDPPARVLLWRWGANITAKGTFWLTNQSAQLIIKDFEQRANPLVFDVDHKSLNADSDIKQSVAVGFATKLSTDAVGLWADGMQWTELGHTLIKTGGYLYDSPVIIASAQKIITKLIAGSITNFPAKNNAQPLLFSIGGTSMDEEMFKVKMKPLRDIQLAFGMIINCIQESMKSNLEGEFADFAKTIGAQIPDWSFALNKIIDTMDPDGETLPKSEGSEEAEDGKKIEIEIPVANNNIVSEKAEFMQDNFVGELLSFSKELFGSEDPLVVKASILAMSDNKKILDSTIESLKNENLKLQKRARVDQGIIDHKILVEEREKFMKFSDLEIDTYLKMKIPKINVFSDIQQPAYDEEKFLAKLQSSHDVPREIKERAERHVDKMFSDFKKL